MLKHDTLILPFSRVNLVWLCQDRLHTLKRQQKFNDIHLLQLGQFMYSYKSSSLPLKFSNESLQNSQFHNYNTRNSHALHLPYCRTNVKKFSVFFQGPKFYNSLDSEIINTNSIYSFKKTFKNKIINNYE